MNHTTTSSPPRLGRQALSTDGVRLYLEKIGRVAMLTPEQELQLGKQVQKMMALKAIAAAMIRESDIQPNPTEWAKQAQLSVIELEKQLTQGEQAQRTMLTANLRLVVSVAKKYQGRNLELLDLIQEGTIGLQRAVEKYDPQRGFRFSTYAHWWIRQGITRAIADKARTIRLPVHTIETLNKIKRSQRQLSQSLGRSPSVTEIGEALNLSVSQVRNYLELGKQTLSLDTKVGEHLDTTLTDFIEAHDCLPEEFANQEALQESVQQLISNLPPLHQKVLTLRFGLADGQECSLAEIGRRLDYSTERIRQIQKEAMQRLQQHRGRVQDYLCT